MPTFLNMRVVAVGLIALAIFATLGVRTFAKNDGGTRPGWGNGDKNHEHTGPPGQSVRPGDDNDDQGEDNNDQGENDNKGGNHDDKNSNDTNDHQNNGHGNSGEHEGSEDSD